ncbi:MAG: efflux RND transporter periplasmic adaptor subunit [Pseudomonadota bacterium]
MLLLSSRRRLLIAASLTTFIAAAGLWFAFGQESIAAEDTDEEETETVDQGPPPAPVRVAEAVETTLAPLSDIPGSVISSSDSLIASATVGKLEWVAEIGAEIDEGAVIARLDQQDAVLARDEAKSDIGRLQARFEYLSSLYDRYVGLGEDTGEPAATLDEMRANKEEALQNLKRAEVALRRAETTLARTSIRAPFRGRIVSREIEVGEFANAGTPIARLVNTSDTEVTAQAPASILDAVSADDRIMVIRGSEEIEATVKAIVPVGDLVSRTMELRISMPETDWLIGEAVRVRVPATRPRLALAAPRDALVLRADRVSVFKIDNEMAAKQIDVDLGTAEGDLIEIVGDIAAGDRLVVRGGERLRDGQKVTIKEDEDTNQRPTES